jgi:hypothetical protein
MAHLGFSPFSSALLPRDKKVGEGGRRGCARWILDTAATNHMTREHDAFSEINSGVYGTVRFGDSSMVGIKGRDKILFRLKSGEYQALDEVCMGQLEEDGFKILMENDALWIWYHWRRLLA